MLMELNNYLEYIGFIVLAIIVELVIKAVY